MKKILILAYDFPPYVSVGGLRPYAWHKYFRRFGLEPIVVTRQWDPVRQNALDYIAPSEFSTVITEETQWGIVLKAPYKPTFSNQLLLKYGASRFKVLRKTMTFLTEFFQFVLPVGPKRPLYLAARDFLKQEKVDFIIATGEPFILFKYAKDLSQTFNIPWIADYRDPWRNGLQQDLLRRTTGVFEPRILKHAAMVSTVSELFKKRIFLHSVDKPTLIIPNGFDADSVALVDSVAAPNDLIFTFAGSLYPWHPLEAFIREMCRFMRENPKIPIQMQFIGTNQTNNLKGLIQLLGADVAHQFEILGRMPNPQVLEKLRLSQCLVLFNDYEIMGTKIYDYLAIKRKVLFCYANDPDSDGLMKKHYHASRQKDASNLRPQEDLIRAYNAGVIVPNASQLQSKLSEIRDGFLQLGFVSCESGDVSAFSRESQTEQLAKGILDYHNQIKVK